METSDIVRSARQGAYLLALLVPALLSLIAICLFLALIDASTDHVTQIILAVAGLMLLCLGATLLIWLNRRIPARTVFLRFGGVLFWLGWAMPLLSLLVGIACTTASVLGFETSVLTSSQSHDSWDWD